MNVEWDENKNEANIAKHGLDFADAPRIFNLPLRISLDEQAHKQSAYELYNLAKWL